MTTYIADTGVFVRCGGPDNQKYQRLRRAVRQAGVSLLAPRRVYEELGGDPDDEAYPSSNSRWQEGVDEGWIRIADELDHTNPRVSRVMDAARRFIANDTDRPEDTIEKTDTALIGLAAQLFDTRQADSVVLFTTDKPAGRAAESLLPSHGFTNDVEYRYVSVEFLETITATEFDD
ncbi:hypothetical protein BG842_06535 [Haladaptatus sp. W1]|uniref:hypothetical protein n=1 Tax=Haladaptatus sp. W1 TaxID=1897478 RepID=UPI0008497659|nr:hypothetical protein [Haladaptatus sp. W1]ODR79558.1 hypothetical protein BG842_06535 [Haladaptatus sp. W1]